MIVRPLTGKNTTVSVKKTELYGRWSDLNEAGKLPDLIAKRKKLNLFVFVKLFSVFWLNGEADVWCRAA